MENNQLTVANATNMNEVQKICNLDMNNEDNKIALYNVLSGSADVMINDIVGQVIEIAGIYIENRPTEVMDEATGEVRNTIKHRTILFGTDGKSYVSGSYGLYQAVDTLCTAFGMPTKEHPIKVRVAKRPTKVAGHDTLTLLYEK